MFKSLVKKMGRRRRRRRRQGDESSDQIFFSPLSLSFTHSAERWRNVQARGAGDREGQIAA